MHLFLKQGIKTGYLENVFSYFLGNTTNDSVYSWTGPQGNMALEETFRMMFSYDLESVSFRSNQPYTEATWFLLPEGVCRSYEGNVSTT